MQVPSQYERRAILSRAAMLEARRQQATNRFEAESLAAELVRLGLRLHELESRRAGAD